MMIFGLDKKDCEPGKECVFDVSMGNNSLQQRFLFSMDFW